MEFWMHFFMLLLEHFALHFIIVIWLFRSCFFKIETVYFEVSHTVWNFNVFCSGCIASNFCRKVDIYNIFFLHFKVKEIGNIFKLSINHTVCINLNTNIIPHCAFLRRFCLLMFKSWWQLHLSVHTIRKRSQIKQGNSQMTKDLHHTLALPR